jgi:ABC-type branched-subunit amino acid transport system permease subunit
VHDRAFISDIEYLSRQALAAVSGIVIGIPAIRIRRIYLIILTLGVGEIVRVYRKQNQNKG